MAKPSADKLLGLIECVGGIADEGFSSIVTIANLALARLETPEAYRQVELIAEALEVIRLRAIYAREGMVEQTEHLGFTRVDTAKLRRLTASARNAGLMN